MRRRPGELRAVEGFNVGALWREHFTLAFHEGEGERGEKKEDQDARWMSGNGFEIHSSPQSGIQRTTR